MSIEFKNRGFFVGNHAWFAEEGIYIPSTGKTVDNENIPSGEAEDLICWQDLGEIVKVSPNLEMEKVTAQGPDPCVLVDVDEVVKSVKRTWTIDVETLTKLGKQLIFGTDLDSETGEGVIDSKVERKGWLVWSAVNQHKVVAVTCNIWGNLTKDGSTDIGGGDFTKPSFTFTQLISPITNKIKFNV